MTAKPTDPKYIAQDILSRRDHSEWELRQKLHKKGISPQDTAVTVAWLKEKKYLNDETFARRYIESTIRSKAVGRRYLAFKLKQKHVASNVISQALAEIINDDVEKQLAAKAAQTWQKSHPKHAADKVRLTRFLISRGFSQHVIAPLKGQEGFD